MKIDSFKKFLNKKVMSNEQLAQKHEKSVDYIKNQIKRGTKVELEHTKKHDVAEQIARKHVEEMHDYYDKLSKIETKEN